MVDFDTERNSALSASDTVADCLDDGWILTLDQGTCGTEAGVPRAPLHSEEARLRTFRHWPPDWGEQLARFGFSSTTQDDQASVRCVFCGRVVTDFFSPQEAHLRHWQSARGHDCRFLRGEDVGNVPLVRNSRTRASLSHSKTPTTDDSRVLVERERLFRASVRPHAERQGSSSSIGGGRGMGQEGEQRAHGQWQDFFSRAEHRPQTTILPTGPPSSAMKRTPGDATVVRQRSHGQETATTTTTTTTTRTSSAPVHWTELVRTARYPRMAAYQARLQTLSRWPLLKPSPAELAKAGFFHVRCQLRGRRSAGECGDSVKCFWCGERIHRWQKTDDALVEHARLSPDCLFVTQILGRQLHDDIAAYRVTAAAMRRCDDVVHGVDVSMPENTCWSDPDGTAAYSGIPSYRPHTSHVLHTRTAPAEAETEQQQGTPSPVLPPHHHHHHHTTLTTTTTTSTSTSPPSFESRLDDLMASPHVQDVLQMGFPPQLIRDVLSHSSMRLTTDTLCDLALQASWTGDRSVAG
ncbi:death-associated inhibitor of apoptosis 1-like [Babylonia areolata]|uniref:death-associated inhibitor of apoptosis 1-like n=1 Tax=Babylonia areolata TaxID=304850 RepID=UPI003FCFC6F2